jgi:hypothetical protein
MIYRASATCGVAWWPVVFVLALVKRGVRRGGGMEIRTWRSTGGCSWRLGPIRRVAGRFCQRACSAAVMLLMSSTSSAVLDGWCSQKKNYLRDVSITTVDGRTIQHMMLSCISLGYSLCKLYSLISSKVVMNMRSLIFVLLLYRSRYCIKIPKVCQIVVVYFKYFLFDC